MTRAERAKMVRMLFRLTCMEFAASLGITGGLVSAMERGRANVSLKTAKKMEDKFDISPKWLIFGTGTMFIREDLSVEKVLEHNPDEKRLYELREKKYKSAEALLRNHATELEKRENRKKEAAVRMKKIRSAYQINQNQLAKRLGYTRAYISAVEKGLQSPSRRMAELIEAEFGVSAEWLLFGNVA